MSLREYQRKRHFQRTPEPKGHNASSAGRAFVIQKHAARNLHYDFRLELDGVLKSWAVPKGPCLDPTVKRLAMQVEDHPVEYGSFEGVIPAGEYGGGTVMLWDDGEWEAIGDADEGYRTGKLKFILRGQKLHGRWMLVRTNRGEGEKRQWLLFKERDEEARPLKDGDILEDAPLSVSTGRDMDDIAAERDRVWNSNRDNGTTRKRPAAKPRKKRGEPLAKMPTRIDVQLATRADQAPDGDQWLHEIKFDGYRILVRIVDGQATLLSRNHKDWTARFALVAEAAGKLPVEQAIFDGEIVALRGDGVSDFQELQNAIHDRRAGSLHYYIFDVLHLDGRDLTQTPLIERKKLLADLLKPSRIPRNIHVSEHLEGNGPNFLAEACKQGLEGIVSKRRDRPYVPGRGADWLKVKCVQTEEFVIGGYTDPAGERVGFGALLVGYHDRKGNLLYAGKVGTGFGDRTLKTVLAQLEPLRQDKSPFKDLHRAPKGTHWVAPTLVAQVAFGSRTRDGILRHASFQGLRDDKAADEVTHETTLPLAKALANGKAKPAKKADKAAAPEYDAAKEKYAGVRLTSPDKVLYPERGITKLELANYYRTIADWMLPHIADRPLVLVRCPEGRHEDCFFQKHPGIGTPAAFRQVKIVEEDGTEVFVAVDDVAGMISLAQVSALEVHAWGSRLEHIDKPDRLIFDLDPDPTVAWPSVVRAARQIRDFLKELGLQSFVKTTGGKGLHLAVPIEPEREWNEVKDFCKRVATAVVRADFTHYTINPIKAARTGKIYLDYLRNARGATAIVPYSPRARAGGSVSVPLTWEELSPQVHSDHYTIRNLPKRLASLKHDPWARIGAVQQSLEKPFEKLRGLVL